MAFKKSVDFLQKEREEISYLRPVIVFITAPDSTARTSQYKHFEADLTLPAGVLKREDKSINFCLIEASSSLEEFDKQVAAALDLYKEAPHKEIVINAQGSAEGILLTAGDENKTLLTGSHLAEVVLPHTHGHFLHVFVFASYGHTFAKPFYETVRGDANARTKVAVTFFTSAASPNSFDKISTSGTGHVEVTRDLKDYIRTNVEPNAPHKTVDAQVKPGCVIL